MPTGSSLAYVAGGDVTDLPKADRAYVRAHEVRRRSTGLDWAALAPTCVGCGTKSSEVGRGTLCPVCRGDVEPPKPPTPKKSPKPSTPSDRTNGRLKQRLVDLGVTSRQVKDWALGQGLIHELSVGLPPARLVDAYAAAHPSQGVAS